MSEETIGQRLTRLREEAGLSKRELAKRSGVDRVHIIQIEAGKVKSPTLRTAEALAKGLGISPARFFDGNHNDGTEEIVNKLIEYLKQFK